MISRELKRLTGLAFVCTLLNGCGGEPVEVRVEPPTSGNISHVIVSAKADEIRIKDVVVNRGNCGGPNTYMGSGHLKFGQTLTVVSFCSVDDVKEVEVKTDQGDYSFTF